MKTKIIVLICSILPLGLLGQKTLPSDTFRVVKDYQPVLIDAEKILQEAVIDDTLKLETELDYELIDRQLEVEFTPESIEAARIKGEPLIRLYNGYARVGVGNALTPFAELYYNNLRSRKYAIGTHVKYFNMPEVNKLKGSDLVEAKAQVYGKRFWKSNTLTTELDYSLRDFNYYGYYNIQKLTNEELTSSDLKQQYNRFQVNADLSSTKQDSFNLRHEVKLNYSFITNQSNKQEHYINGFAKFSQFKNSELYQLDASLDYNAYDQLNENGILYLRPSITSFGDRFRIKAGLGVYMNASDANNASFHFYPVAEVNYNAIEDVLIPYAGIDGQIQRNNYNSFTEQNPFVSEFIRLVNSNQRYNVYLGLRGALSPKISFNLNGSRVSTEDAAFFAQLPDPDLLISHQFYVIYDDLVENKLKAELSYHSEKINVYLRGNYTQFETDEIEKAWHRPELTASLTTEYNLYNKLVFGIDFIYWSQQYAPNYEVVPNSNPIQTLAKVETLKAIYDVNLSLEYRYTKRLSAFVKFNNLMGLNYEKYKDYPVQGFNVWGGLTYSF